MEFLKNFFSVEMITFLIATLPLSEMRVAIPFAMINNLSWQEAVFWSVLGSFSSPLVLVFLLEKFSDFLSQRYSIFKKFFSWVFERTRKKAHKKIEKYGFWGLLIVTATIGAWTGAAAAFLMGINKKKSLLAIFLGILLATIVVTLITFTGFKASEIINIL